MNDGGTCRSAPGVKLRTLEQQLLTAHHPQHALCLLKNNPNLHFPKHGQCPIYKKDETTASRRAINSNMSELRWNQ